MEMTATEYRNFQKLEKKRLMGFTKGELVEELLAVYGHCRKLQNTAHNSECQHEYEYVNTTPFIGHKCKKCGHCI